VGWAPTELAASVMIESAFNSMLTNIVTAPGGVIGYYGRSFKRDPAANLRHVFRANF
jgi:hypothetical protein